VFQDAEILLPGFIWMALALESRIPGASRMEIPVGEMVGQEA